MARFIEIEETKDPARFAKDKSERIYPKNGEAMILTIDGSSKDLGLGTKNLY